jgi:hypothetical protein
MVVAGNSDHPAAVERRDMSPSHTNEGGADPIARQTLGLLDAGGDGVDGVVDVDHLNLRHNGADFGGADINADDGAMCHKRSFTGIENED